MSIPSIFDWAGGDAAFQRLTTVFYGRVKQDPLLASVFARMALIYSGENPPPVQAADVPTWHWNQTPPWQPSPS